MARSSGGCGGGCAAGGVRAPISGRRLLLAVVCAVAAVLAIACAERAAPGPVPFTAAAERGWAEANGRLDFRAVRPCSESDELRVSAVFVEDFPGSRPAPRVHVVVQRRGERLFILSETRALVPFTAIPQSTRRLEVRAGGAEAAGFVGPSGSGPETAYLRWRKDEVTYELNATLGGWFTLRRFERLAAATMEGC